MRSLITGSSGFIGSWLARQLQQEGEEVFGLDHTIPPADHTIHQYSTDLTDGPAITDLIKDIRPDRVWHLAAQSNIPRSFASPQETLTVNLQGSLCLFSAVQFAAPQATVISVGSSAEYGFGGSHQKFIDEDTPLLPSSPYGISKAAQGLFAALYARTYGIRIMHVRPFAVIGPGKKGDALSDFCRAVVQIQQGNAQEILTGNLETIRDFIDVRDCIQAFLTIAHHGRAGQAYNVCNGAAAAIGDLVAILQKKSSRKFSVVMEPKRARPADDQRLVGNNSRLVALGYSRRYRLENTVAATLEYWRTFDT